jgi:hypothetical protein
MKVHHKHRKTHDFINKKGLFDTKSLVALWAKLLTGWKRHDQSKGNSWVGSIFPFYRRTLSSILESAHCLLHTLLLPSMLWGFQSILPPVHSLIQYLKHDWVKGSNSCLEFLRMLSTQLWANA